MINHHYPMIEPFLKHHSTIIIVVVIITIIQLLTLVL